MGDAWGTMGADGANLLVLEEADDLAGMCADGIVSVLQDASSHNSNARIGKVDWLCIEF